jgi:hypothetical protein
MKNGFDTEEAYARMNHLIDVIRGNMFPAKFSELTKEYQKIYLDEAKIADYVITEDDMDQLEEIILRNIDIKGT